MASKDSFSGDRIGVTRRTFLGTTLAGGVAVVGGSLSAGWRLQAEASDTAWVEKSIGELQGMLGSGQLSSRELTLGYLDRIRQFNGLLHAVIETNPQAVAVAAQRDAERAKGILRGPCMAFRSS